MEARPGSGIFSAKLAAKPLWPRDDPAALAAFYGAFELKADGTPTMAWEAAHLVTLVPPFPMRVAWDPRVAITRIRCHKLVAESLRRVLQAILAHFGTRAAIRRAGMDLYGGAYNFRRISGAERLSVHAWGAAIDLDPGHNPLGRAWASGCGMMPMEVVALFEAEGWVWGGRFKGRKDCMHFQAAG